jgi:N-acetylglucosamine-6-phosphate deacetylase
MENEIGGIIPGAKATFVIVDDMIRVKKVFLEGAEFPASVER